MALLGGFVATLFGYSFLSSVSMSMSANPVAARGAPLEPSVEATLVSTRGGSDLRQSPRAEPRSEAVDAKRERDHPAETPRALATPAAIADASQPQASSTSDVRQGSQVEAAGNACEPTPPKSIVSRPHLTLVTEPPNSSSGSGAPAAEEPYANQACTTEACGPQRQLGTAIQWAENPEQAAKLAQAQGKLVFLIQVSGNFARDEFT